MVLKTEIKDKPVLKSKSEVRSNTLESIAITQALFNLGYKKESDFILKELLLTGTDQTTFEKIIDSNKFNNSNYFDNLSYELTDKYNVCYSCFTDIEGKTEILEAYYSSLELKVLSLDGIDKLFYLLSDETLIDYIDYTEAIKQLQKVTKEILYNLTITQLNKVLLNFFSYNKFPVEKDIIFRHKNDILLLNTANMSYNVVDYELTDLKEFINDIVDNMVYISDFGLLFDYCF